MAGVRCQFDVHRRAVRRRLATFTVSGDFEGAMIKGALGKAVEKDGVKQLDETLQQLGDGAGGRVMVDDRP